MWNNPKERQEYTQFWYLAYHTLFWLDLYLSCAVEGFSPPVPFTLDELEPAGVVPKRPYIQEELLGYLAYCRQKCQATIEALTDETAQRRCRFGWGKVSFVELLLFNMRHVQEHADQLSLVIGQSGVSAPGWVPMARSSSA